MTTSPVGRCVILTALSVVLTDWPPGPLERNTSIRRSLSSIWMSTSSASGNTATVDAAFEFEAGKDVAPGDRGGRLLDTAEPRVGQVEQFEAPALQPLVALVH